MTEEEEEEVEVEREEGEGAVDEACREGTTNEREPLARAGAAARHTRAPVGTLTTRTRGLLSCKPSSASHCAGAHESVCARRCLSAGTRPSDRRET